ncbi:1-aminocyclopropane-1-carboxylate deaminase/D-cysteine desulfhydrase [Pedobacter frigidisoli]|uniref:1-aminocyclopropane-1-carboxylate deaminase/D-cysteine desulfhydrase n=1 Tax=Pedobacter frigidisoli TaxID=2530455 RepID=UPI002931E223|nr:pyridoxal-phosphate dependent enzyme [Pedobacter frigidisoli]
MFDKINSPVEKLNYSPFSNLFVKRDDLIDPFISGNKWRKLKYILAKAQEAGRNHLVTFGGTYSNHLVATAAAAARTGLKATAFVRGEAVNNEMLMLCRLFGMELIFTNRESYRNKEELFRNYFADDSEAYFIDEGGASPEAATGCAEIIDELPAIYDHIFCAAGTGTTAAGLLAGIQKHELETHLHVVSALKGGSFLTDEINSITPVSDHLHLHTEYHFGGYAKTTSELISFIQNFTRQTGLLIDPVYTGKMFYAITDLQQKGILHQDDRILAIHTGGLLGMFGMKDKF